MARRWKQAPPGAHWGEFGDDDQRGRMNLVTPAKVLQGMAEVHEGRTFCLSLPLDVPGGRALNPRRRPPERFAVLRDGKLVCVEPMARYSSAELVNLMVGRELDAYFPPRGEPGGSLTRRISGPLTSGMP